MKDPAVASNPHLLFCQHDNLLPQQVTVPSARSPYELNAVAKTAVKVPDGASNCPWPLLPQQVTVASVRSPHEYS